MENDIGINVSFPIHRLHIRIDDGYEFTDKDILRWTDTPPSLGTNQMRRVIQALAQIIVGALELK